MSDKKESMKNKRKQRIIDAAIEVIKEKTVEEATVREIAARAGLTTGAIYHHYKNKDELLYDVINHSIHFIHKFATPKDVKDKSHEDILNQVKSEVVLRLSKLDEQKLHILLISDILSKDCMMKEKYKENYITIINKVADYYYLAFGIENERFKRSLASIFVAALDGMAIQCSLGVLPDSQENFVKTFNDFFAESIPLFLKQHNENNEK